jgi:hypothetical protein
VEGKADGVAGGVDVRVIFQGAGDAGVAVGEFGAVGVVGQDFEDFAGGFDLVGVGHGDGEVLDRINKIYGIGEDRDGFDGMTELTEFFGLFYGDMRLILRQAQDDGRKNATVVDHRYRKVNAG